MSNNDYILNLLNIKDPNIHILNNITEKVVKGKNPIVDHRFLGPSDMEGKYVIVADDMIASGGSILDTAEAIKKLGVEKIFLVVTFALFTEGVDKFQEYFNKGVIDRVYASNVSYVP